MKTSVAPMSWGQLAQFPGTRKGPAQAWGAVALIDVPQDVRDLVAEVAGEDFGVCLSDWESLAARAGQEGESVLVVIDARRPSAAAAHLAAMQERHPRLRQVPVIALVSSRSAGATGALLGAGAADCVSLEPSKGHLRALLRTWALRARAGHTACARAA